MEHLNCIRYDNKGELLLQACRLDDGRRHLHFLPPQSQPHLESPAGTGNLLVIIPALSKKSGNIVIVSAVRPSVLPCNSSSTV